MLIIHGDNQVQSRAHFLAAREKAISQHNAIISLAGADITLADVQNSISIFSLLGTTNALFIEGFFSRRPSNEKKSILENLLTSQNSDITLWDGKDISTQIKSFDPKLIKKFDLPKFIFNFVDNLTIGLYHQSLSASDPEMIMGLIAKRIHDLILAKENKLTIPDWQLAKIKSQSQKYSLDQLIRFNTELLAIDYKQKTSSSPFDLKSALEVWLIKLNNKTNDR